MQRDKGVRFDVSRLMEMLPLFLFSGCYDVPVIFIISDGPVPLSCAYVMMATPTSISSKPIGPLLLRLLSYWDL